MFLANEVLFLFGSIFYAIELHPERQSQGIAFTGNKVLVGAGAGVTALVVVVLAYVLASCARRSRTPARLWWNKSCREESREVRLPMANLRLNPSDETYDYFDADHKNEEQRYDSDESMYTFEPK